MDLKLLQKDVAEIFSVSEDCITFWENNRNNPQIRYYPRIIKFLGYWPIKLELLTFNDRIRSYRFLNGLSQKRFADMMNVDPKTLVQLENGKGNIIQKMKIEKFLGNYDFKINSF
ncbi:helix-turn-helix domain-containing protein [Sphingobacterium multivorum]|uniref:helix-turn-helix domain-containing protein n=1 Tax=Sphingobacterium multivorum TaxID=28454 RepID=UPI003DA5E5AB